ncbi:MAG: NAD-binding protein [Bacilli bacterium]|jgi:trk system potassium uptake protein TrkA|nr:NAD-binding protein [Bacilli bacterium]MCH4210360.1 NAD-binding protein [Bacilli bacterium]MCH4228848.1 NAD-binding protein [Bacilli bacterium]MCH4277986.1 NAD-binding protein [Bacilli bacterium]MCI2054750.1 NAD-binding protein [Bacilli bacterium]
MKIVIANGNRQASFIIEMFKKKENQLIVINSSRSLANELTKKEHISVYVGSPWRNYALEEAGVHDADVFISLCEKDTDNYACCILAKKVFNVKKCICVVNNPDNVELYKKLGIDSVISSTYLLAQNIKTESSMESLIKTLSLENDKIIVIEAPVLSKYQIAGKKLMDINFPKYASISAIYRNFSVIIPNGQVEIRPKDILLIVCAPKDQKKILSFIQMESSKESE